MKTVVVIYTTQTLISITIKIYIGLNAICQTSPFRHSITEFDSYSSNSTKFSVVNRKCNGLHRGSYMSAHVLLNLLNELGKRDKMRGLPSILSLFCNEFN